MKFLKPYLLLCLFSILTFGALNAQVAINNDGSLPDTSAMLDVSSTDRGLLIPRMTSIQRDNIYNPATGLMVYNTDDNSFWYFDGTAWTTLGQGAFSSTNGLITADQLTDDFVLGANSLEHNSGAERKLFFDESKGALRAGVASNANWNDANVGYSSSAFGANTKANGQFSFASGSGSSASSTFSTAMGNKSIASGESAVALGNESKASAFSATAMGNKTTASGVYATALGSFTTASANSATALGNESEATAYISTAMGNSTKASGSESTAMGYYSEASGNQSTAMGNNSKATGAISTAMGNSTKASGYTSTTMGHDTEASGKTATALGHQTKAPSYAETVLGTYNTDYTPANTNSFDANDRLLVVGNGTADNSRSDALIVHKSGDTQINGRLSIHNSGAAPDSSAMVDISSTSKGILIPRMTTSQRMNIHNPATGLMVFDTETTGFWFYDGANWVDLRVESLDELVDTDDDTKIQVERNPDEDQIRFEVKGEEIIVVDSSLIRLTKDTHFGSSYRNSNSVGVVDYRANSSSIGTSNSNEPGWQSFIPTKSGYIDFIRMQTLDNGSAQPPSSITFSIYEGEGTGGNLLTTTTLSPVGANQWNTIPIPGDVFVLKGLKYTVGFSNRKTLG
ncbi:MAG: hypothetical protein AAF985_22000, partial [Bacteroidota bacterium]